MKQISIFFLFFILNTLNVFGNELSFDQWKNEFKKKVLDNNISESIK